MSGDKKMDERENTETNEYVLQEQETKKLLSIAEKNYGYF